MLTPWLAVNGVQVPVAEGSRGTRRRTIEIGQRRRAINGAMRSSVFTRKNEWQFTTPPIDTGLRDRILEQLESSSLPLTCIGAALGGSAYADVTFTRSGAVGPYTDVDGVLKSAAANVVRREWLWLNDQVGPPDTESLLIEAARPNLVDEDDLTAWSTSGTPVVTGSISDPAGATGAFRVEDDDGAALEFPFRNITFTGDGVKVMAFAVREATMASSGNQVLVLTDTSAGASRLSLTISAWSGGEPTVAASTGTYLGKRYAGNGYWVLYGRSTSVTAANTNRVEIQPANTAAATGSLDVYRVNAFNDAGAPSYSILDASETRNADLWYGDFAHKQQPLSVYVKFVEFGAGFTVTNAGGIVSIGGAGAGDDPRFQIVSLASSDGRYTATYDNGTVSAVTATLGAGAATSYGDVVELVAQLDYNEDGDGDIRIAQSKNGGATTAFVNATGPSGGLNEGKRWNLDPARIYLGSQGTSAESHVPIISAKVASGIKSMDRMRSMKAPDLFGGISLGEVSCYAEIGELAPVTIEGQPMWVLDFSLFQN